MAFRLLDSLAPSGESHHDVGLLVWQAQVIGTNTRTLERTIVSLQGCIRRLAGSV